MSIRRSFVLLALTSILAIGACVEDPLPPEIAIPLTEEEAELLGLQAFREVLLKALEVTRDTAQAVAAGPSLTPTSFSSVDSLTTACPYGGSVTTKVTLSGTVDPDAGSGDLQAVAVETHTDCQVKEGQLQFHLDGAPAITLAFSLVLRSSGAIDAEGSLTGGLRATVGIRSSTCDFDVNFSGAAQPDGSSSFTYEGTVCGTVISEKTITPAT